MVSGANVLGVGCTTNFTINNTDFTNQVLTPVLEWLTNNPTKRPQYMVLFWGMPQRLQTMTGIGSPIYILHEAMPAFQPFVTCINMVGTNACQAYIDKLEYFGTNNSPGQLVISASQKWTPKFGPAAKLDFPGSGWGEKRQSHEQN